MKLNLENDYAYRIILAFARQPEGTKIRSKDLSDNYEIPERFTYRILRKLMFAGLVDSIRGPQGGYVLSKDPKDITLYDVYKAISGELLINSCLRDGVCEFQDGKCEIHNELTGIQNTIVSEFKSVNFQDIVDKYE